MGNNKFKMKFTLCLALLATASAVKISKDKDFPEWVDQYHDATMHTADSQEAARAAAVAHQNAINMKSEVPIKDHGMTLATPTERKLKNQNEKRLKRARNH